MSQALDRCWRTLPGSILTTTMGSISSSHFNREGELSSKTLPTITWQVRGKAKIWTQDSPTTLLSLVVERARQDSCLEHMWQDPSQPGWPSLLHVHMVVEMNAGGGRWEICVPERSWVMVAVNTCFSWFKEGRGKGDTCMWVFSLCIQ